MSKNLNNIKSDNDNSIYFDWAKRVCAAKNIHINKDITQLNNRKLFRISSDVGDLYLKKTTDFHIDEIRFTQQLMTLGLISLPEWIGYSQDLKLCLTRDMGGSDLSLF